MFQSDQIDQLAAALALAQAELDQPAKNAVNPHFGNRYADLHKIMTTILPVLAKHGLSVVQSTSLEASVVVLHTRLLHTSGQWIAGAYPVVPVKPDPQGYGSAMTYARRYALSAIIGLAADDDDDGEAASAKGLPVVKLEKPPVTRAALAPAVNGSRRQAVPAALAEPEDPESAAGCVVPGDFVVPIGKNAGKRLRELSRETLAWYASELRPTSDQGHALQKAAQAYLASL
jgi:hypothetical protein